MKKFYLVIALISASVNAQILYQEDFETNTNGSNYFTSTPEQTDGGTDFFTRTDGGDISSAYNVTGENNLFYFAAQDIDAEDGINPKTLTTAPVDVSGQADITFSILMAEDDNSTSENWDTSDYVHVTYSIDGGTDQNLIWIEANSSTITSSNGFSNGKPFTDPNFDGDGIDGVEITSQFINLSESISLSGAASITFKIEFSLDSGDEDIAIDNINVEVTPVLNNPTFTALENETILYPNPTFGEETKLQTSLKGNFEVTILNGLGQIESTQIIEDDKMISTTGLVSGMYFVQLNNEGNTVVKKLFVE